MKITVIAAVIAAVAPQIIHAEPRPQSNNPIYDLSAVLKDSSGTILRDDLSQGKKDNNKPCGEDSEQACLTAARAVINALELCTGAPFCPDVKKPSPDEKYHREDLARMIHAHPEAVSISYEDREMLKKLVGEMYTPVTVWSVYNSLNTTVKQKESTE